MDRHVIHGYNDLQFGPDGYLYVAVGDEGGYNDENNNSQRIDKNLFSGILRLDVDHRPGSLAPNPHPSVTANYAIPPDNPFVGADSFNTPQLNRDANYSGILTNQIQALSQAGYLDSPVANIHLLRALAPHDDPAWSLEYRARSYLAVNCAPCHQPGGTGGGFWDARIITPLSAAGIVEGHLQNDLGNSDNRVMSAGAPHRSMILRRISTLGPETMPPLANRLTNAAALALLSDWIAGSLTNYRTFPQWQLAIFGSTNSPDSAAQADVDGDRAPNYLEYLTGTDPWAPFDFWKIRAHKTHGTFQIIVPQIAHRGFEVQRSSNFKDWSGLNVPANRPFFSETNRLMIVEDPIATDSALHYRVRVFEP